MIWGKIQANVRGFWDWVEVEPTPDGRFAVKDNGWHGVAEEINNLDVPLGRIVRIVDDKFSAG